MSGVDRPIDWMVLTAASRAQAEGYRAQLAAREVDGRLGRVRNWLVMPDPGDRRAGSGGSTLVVLHELARLLSRGGAGGRASAALFRGRRILIIHSGGDSRRLPAYAAEGKVFTPLPCDTPGGDPATLFDLVLADLAALPLPDEGRVVIATGDVFLGLAEHAPDLGAPGMVGVAFPGPAETGSRHGVYIRGRGGRVAGFLQKPDRAEARRRGALDSRGRVLIDTGVLSLDPAAAAAWLRAGGELARGFIAGRGRPLDLYQEILLRLAMPGTSAAGHPGLYRGLRRLPFCVAVVPPCDFLHIGSTRELVRIITGDARIRRGPPGSGPTEYNCAGRSPAGPSDAIAENCRLDRRVTLGHGSVLAGFPGGSPLALPDEWGLTCLPIGPSSWACVAFGLGDDFKTPRERGGTLGGMRLDAWLRRVGLDAGDVFAGDADGSLWSARLWIAGTLRQSLRAARWVMRGRGPAPAAWLRGRRLSLAELAPRANLARILEQRSTLQREEGLALTKGSISLGRVPPVRTLLRVATEGRAASRLAASIGSRLRRAPSHFERARLYRAAAELSRARPGLRILGRSPADLDHAALACVASGVARDARIPGAGARAAIRPGQVVTASCPVRIDLAGGWSDTPPICHELGGAVVNAAITLEGERPLRAGARLLDEPVIRLQSHDLRRSITIADWDAAPRYHDPRHWAALPMAALALAGITPRSAGGSLSRRMAEFGGGLELTMAAAVPKGSGLGTSSILGAAVLACLDRVCGRRPGVRPLIERTSVLEQMMSTAGGWQDQAGGITPGIKILRTSPGAHQVPSVTPIRPPALALRELHERSILYYTGQRRLARDILQGVVRRYLAGDSATVRIVHDLKSAAEQMAGDLRRGDIDAMARGVLRNWELKKAIDPGSTNERIEAILRPLLPRLSGYELAGAGGGGFIFMMARSAGDAAAVRRLLARRRGRTGAQLVGFGIDTVGITVEVADGAQR